MKKKKVNYYDFLESIGEVEHYKDFLNLIEQNICDKYKFIWEAVESSYSHENKNMKNEIFNDIIVESGLYGYDFTLYSAFILAYYSYIEQLLDEICKEHEERTNLNIKLSDLKGKGIMRSKLYLKKIANINFEEINNEWEKVQKIRKVRNYLAHEGNSSIITSRGKNNKENISEDLKIFISLGLTHKSEGPFSGDEFYYSIRLTKSFCLDIISIFDDFIKKIYEQIDSKSQ